MGKTNIDIIETTKIVTAHGYDYYRMKDTEGKYFYCLVREGNNKPTGGYYSSNYAAGIKQVPNLF